MYKILLVFIVFILVSCEKENKDFGINNSALNHAELGFEVDEPDTILNELARGKLDQNITSVLKQIHDNFPEPAERYWKFEYVENSDRIDKMTYYLPHYVACEKNNYQFYYNEKKLIDSVISNRKNLFKDDNYRRKYTFNYNEQGLLKSIFMDNESFVEENFFSYYPNGKVKAIYNDFRGRGTEIGFNVQEFYYDSSFKNVVKVEHRGSTGSHYTYKYFYDEKVNPFKDYFIAVSVSMPHIGPAYLSENNVKKVIEKNQNNIHDNEFTYEYDFNFSNSDILESYSDKDVEASRFILYATNR